MRVKVFLFSVFIFVLFASMSVTPSSNHQNNDEIISVSMMNLIVTPEKYENKMVSFIGYIIVDRETIVYDSKDDSKTHNFQNGVLFIISPAKTLDLKKKHFNKKYVRVIGRFITNIGGNKSMFCNGMIKNSRIYKM